MFRPLLRLASRSGERARLSILIFHRVLPVPDPLFPGEIEAGTFSAICGWLRSWFNVLPLDLALSGLGTGRLPTRACAITFDDGYADNRDVALPILRQHGLCATFFISTGFLDGGRMWNDTIIETLRASKIRQLDLRNLPGCGSGVIPIGSIQDRRAAIDKVIQQLKYLPVSERSVAVQQLAEMTEVRPPDDLMMTSAQVRELHQAGMQIGAHTVTHPILATLDSEAAMAEMATSKQTLESLLGERVGLFAYPNGRPEADYRAETVALVRKAGFDGAVSTAWGTADRSTDLFQVPRFTPWDRSKLRFGLRLADNLRRRQTRPALLDLQG